MGTVDDYTSLEEGTEGTRYRFSHEFELAIRRSEGCIPICLIRKLCPTCTSVVATIPSNDLEVSIIGNGPGFVRRRDIH